MKGTISPLLRIIMSDPEMNKRFMMGFLAGHTTIDLGNGQKVVVSRRPQRKNLNKLRKKRNIIQLLLGKDSSSPDFLKDSSSPDFLSGFSYGFLSAFIPMSFGILFTLLIQGKVNSPTSLESQEKTLLVNNQQSQLSYLGRSSLTSKTITG